jgi:hypothetical protein
VPFASALFDRLEPGAGGTGIFAMRRRLPVAFLRQMRAEGRTITF